MVRAPIEAPSTATYARPSEGRSRLPWLDGYEVIELFGEGGMGIVYKARHLKRNRLVALKMIGGGRRKILARFRAEAEVVARLQHPYIVQIVEIGGGKSEGEEHGAGEGNTYSVASPNLVIAYLEGLARSAADRQARTAAADGRADPHAGSCD